MLGIVTFLVATIAAPAGALGFGPLSSVGTSGVGAGQLGSPAGVAIAEDGSTYVVDASAMRIAVFASDGSFLRAFGKNVNPGGGDVCTSASGCQAGVIGEGAGAMALPQGVAIGPEGNVFVADWANDRIGVYSPQGVFLLAFGSDVNSSGGGNPDLCTSECKKGEDGEAAGQFAEALKVDFDESGRLYVADARNRRIDVYLPDGTFLRAFGKGVNPGGGDVCTSASGCQAGVAVSGDAGAMRNPVGIGVGPGGLVAVTDPENSRVEVFTVDGTFLRAFGKDVNPSGGNVCSSLCQAGESSPEAGAFEKPTDAAIDAAGNVYVADSNNHRINQFGLDGSFVRAFGEGVIDGAEAFQVCALVCVAGLEGTIPGAVSESFGVAVDCHGAVYATEETVDFARVERFGEPGTAAPPCLPATTPIAAPVPPSNKFRFGKLKRNLKKGTALLLVRIPGPGSLALRGKGIRKAKRAGRKAGNVKLPVKLVGKAKRKLLRIGASRVRAKVTFTPSGGKPLTKSRSLTLRKTLR